MRRPAPSSLDAPLLLVAMATPSCLCPRTANHQASIRTLDGLALEGRCILRSVGVGCCNLLIDFTLARGLAIIRGDPDTGFSIHHSPTTLVRLPDEAARTPRPSPTAGVTTPPVAGIARFFAALPPRSAIRGPARRRSVSGPKGPRTRQVRLEEAPSWRRSIWLDHRRGRDRREC